MCEEATTWLTYLSDTWVLVCLESYSRTLSAFNLVICALCALNHEYRSDTWVTLGARIAIPALSALNPWLTYLSDIQGTQGTYRWDMIQGTVPWRKHSVRYDSRHSASRHRHDDTCLESLEYSDMFVPCVPWIILVPWFEYRSDTWVMDSRHSRQVSRYVPRVTHVSERYSWFKAHKAHITKLKALKVREYDSRHSRTHVSLRYVSHVVASSHIICVRSVPWFLESLKSTRDLIPWVL